MAGKRGIWYYVKNYKFNSLFIKNFLLIILLVVIPMIGISIGIYVYYGRILENEVAAANETSISRVRDTVDMIFNEASNLSLRIAYDTRVTKFMIEQRQEIPDYETIEMIKNAIATVSLSTGDYIHSIYAYSSLNGYVLSSLNGGGHIADFTDNAWKEEYLLNKNVSYIRILPRKAKVGEGKTLNVLSFMLNSPVNETNKNGVVIVNVDLFELEKLINNVSKNREESIYIISESGQVLFTNEMDNQGKQADDIPFLKQYLNDKVQKNAIVKVDGIENVVTTIVSGSKRWEYVSIVPLRNYQQKIITLQRIILILSVFSVIIAVFVAFLISLRVFTPIKDIITLLEQPEEYQYKEEVDNQRRGINEIKYIVSNINSNLNRSKIMEEELANRMALLKQARTLALQSQINPHFLFNTLQTINWLAIGLTKSENEASKVITSLSKLLRATIDTDNYLITMENEFNCAKEYIEIQKVRYKDKFEVEWVMDDNISDCMITQITLQPILENSIYHGIKPKKDKGIIKVSVYDRNDVIVIEVDDNGVGMTVNEMEKFNGELKEDYIQSSSHIGIRNVNQRIKLIFGESYGIYLAQNEMNGLKVKIIIPKVKNDIPNAKIS